MDQHWTARQRLTKMAASSNQVDGKKTPFCPTHHTWLFPDLCDHPPVAETEPQWLERDDCVTALLVLEYSMDTTKDLPVGNTTIDL